MNKKGHITYIFLRTVDTALQNTTENEIARSLRKLGFTISTVVAWENEQTTLDGFSKVIYVSKPAPGILPTLRYHYAALRHMLAQQSDVIMVNFPAMHLVPLAKLGYWFKRKRPLFIMDIRSVPVDVTSSIRNKITIFRYAIAIKIAEWFCDGITVITPALGNTILHKLKRLKNKIGIWGSGVNLDEFQRSDSGLRTTLGFEGKTVLIYHGIMSPNRGISDLVLAVGKLAPEFPELRLILLGDGPGKQELQQITKEHNLENIVYFKNNVPYHKVHEYLSAANAGVLPFPNIEWWSVSSPIKLMEYLAMGLPVIATDITAIRYVTDRTGGEILAKDNSPKALANAIRFFLENGCSPASSEILEEIISWDSQAINISNFIDKLKNSM